MIDYTLDRAKSILYVRPTAAFQQEDFVELARVADPHIEKAGNLAGLVIDAPRFPWWDSLGAMAAHFRFVRDHHKHIRKVALVSDSAIGNVAEHLASHFVAAQIKHFPSRELEAAKAWVGTT